MYCHLIILNEGLELHTELVKLNEKSIQYGILNQLHSHDDTVHENIFCWYDRVCVYDTKWCCGSLCNDYKAYCMLRR